MEKSDQTIKIEIGISFGWDHSLDVFLSPAKNQSTFDPVKKYFVWDFFDLRYQKLKPFLQGFFLHQKKIYLWPRKKSFHLGLVDLRYQKLKPFLQGFFSTPKKSIFDRVKKIISFGVGGFKVSKIETLPSRVFPQKKSIFDPVKKTHFIWGWWI